MAERLGFGPRNDLNPGSERTARVIAIFTNLESYTVTDGGPIPRPLLVCI
jgi:hypothetical protein